MSVSEPPHEPELLRVPGLGFAWTFPPEDPVDGIIDRFATAERLTECAREHKLLTPETVGCFWMLDGKSVPRVRTSVTFTGSLVDPILLALLTGARPENVEDSAVIDTLGVTGPGTWIDAAGDENELADLLTLSVQLVAPGQADVGLRCHHDIWMTHDFRGRPQAEIHARNAPRLAAVLRDFEAILRVEADPDPDILFGTPRRYGIDPPFGDDGSPMDVTQWMKPYGRR